MIERITHNISQAIIDLANGDWNLDLLKEARARSSGMDFFINPTRDEPVFRILRVVSCHVLGMAMQGAKIIVYCEQVSALGFHSGIGTRFDTTARFNPIPGLNLGDEHENDVQVAFRMFGQIIEGGALDTERIGKCHCGRYFLSTRLGQRKSRACSKNHQSILAARTHRASPFYQRKKKAANTQRMRTVRLAERLVGEWIDKGLSRKCRQERLNDWNREQGYPLSDTVLRRILGLDR